MEVTIYDIAKAADVSITTISKILNNKDQDISEKTREKVLNIMNEMNYKPNAVARSLVTKKTNVIGLLIPDISNPYFSEMARGVEDGVNRFGFNVVFCNTDENQEKELEYLQILQEKGMDGIIFVPIAESYYDFIKDIKSKSQKPFVVLDRVYENADKKVGQVVFNNVMGGYLATKYLIDKGHRRIGCVTGSRYNKSSIDRLNGYKKALQEADINFDPSVIFEGDYRYNSGVASGRFFEKSDVTAIFIENDIMASGVYRTFNECGIKIPDDISIVGYDDINLSLILNPPLTTILQPKLEMGEKAGEMLARMIQGEKTDLFIEYEPNLIERGSTKSLKG